MRMIIHINKIFSVLCMCFKSPNTGSVNKCRLVNWNGKDEVVAEGRWESKDPNALVNGNPIGRNAVKIYIDEVLLSDTFLWRPASSEICTLEDCLNHFIVWPANRVVYIRNEDHSPSESQAYTTKV